MVLWMCDVGDVDVRVANGGARGTFFFDGAV